MGRRRFEHLHTELSMAVGEVVPRYPLWLRLRDRGCDPEDLARVDAIRFVVEEVEPFLACLGMHLSARAVRRLEAAIRRFDPAVSSPEDVMARLAGPGKTQPR